MRLLHISDLHIGRQFNGLSLETDHEAILGQVLQAVITHAPDALVIAGDIFDRATPPVSAVRQFNRFLTRVTSETLAAVVMIAGNHDSGDRIASMSIMTDPRRALIRGTVAANEFPLVLKDGHGPVAFSALPFVYENAARECFGDETIATPEDALSAEVTAARRNLPEGARWVIVAHAFVVGATGSEGERCLARVGGIETVGINIFEGAHYVALGHLHRPQRVGMDHIRYAGAPLAFGFDEVGDQKSMALVDLDAEGRAAIQTIPFVPVRGVRTVRGKLADLLLAEPSQDFIKAVLTDEMPLIDPMKRLREVFPNACELTYARDERTPEIGRALLREIRVNEPIKVIGNFLEYVRHRGPSGDEAALVASTLDHMQEGRAAA